jgi:hypothetical protein
MSANMSGGVCDLKDLKDILCTSIFVKEIAKNPFAQKYHKKEIK